MEKNEFHRAVFDEIPGRVSAAMGFAYLCKSITDPEATCATPAPSGRALSPREKAAYDAALGLMAQYFHGEADFGGPAMVETFEQDVSMPELVPADSRWHGAD